MSSTLTFDPQKRHYWLILSQDRFLCFDKSSPLLESCWDELGFIHHYHEQLIELEEHRQRKTFLLDLRHENIDQNDDPRVESISLRGALMTADEKHFELFSKAWQYALFLRTHRYCGQCGSSMRRVTWEMAMHCQQCQHRCYPRVSPCIIVAIYRQQQLLLGMGSRHKEAQMYSTFAGFVESGENLEQAVHREVMEEVGVRIKQPIYFGSQPWPFPHSLMVGYIAEWDSGEINIDNDEICDAQWFDVDQLPNTPPTLSIAGQLIEHTVKLIKQQ